VVGQRLARAKTRIRKRHCRVGKVTKKFSTQAKKGRVLKQLPKGSSKKRKNGFRVNLTVGKGPKA
jgi:beta-lactam-binding protein with PASTA domain